MRRISGILLALVMITAKSAEMPDPPLSETRLTIHALLREDIFAGLIENDMQRLARGEKNIQLLLQQRPEAQAPLLGWQASTLLYRAIRAHESGRTDEYRDHYRRSIALFEEANRLDGENVGVIAVTGGSFVQLSDRLRNQNSLMGGQELIPPISRFGKSRQRRSISYLCTSKANFLPVLPSPPNVPAGQRKLPNSSRRFKLYSPTRPIQMLLSNGRQTLSPLRT
jgi:hypothetical protein